MMRLVISLPTRGRPEKLTETINRNLACLSRPDTLLQVQVDKDDMLTREVVTKWNFVDRRLEFNICEREDTIAAKWNRAMSTPADVYTCLGDDDPLIDPDSDERILYAASLFPDGIGMVYGYLCNASFSCCISFTKRMTELLGYIQPEFFPYWFCDHWTDDIGKISGRIIGAQVRTLQCVTHDQVGKTQELREPAWWATWFDANHMVRREHAKRIIHTLNEPDWRKEMAYASIPMVEFRSKWINDNVRANARMLEGWSGLHNKDERYQRVKQKAIDAIPGIMATLPQVEVEFFSQQLTPPTTILNLPSGGFGNARAHASH
jgi:hypothetical protein